MAAWDGEPTALLMQGGECSHGDDGDWWSELICIEGAQYPCDVCSLLNAWYRYELTVVASDPRLVTKTLVARSQSLGIMPSVMHSDEARPSASLNH